MLNETFSMIFKHRCLSISVCALSLRILRVTHQDICSTTDTTKNKTEGSEEQNNEVIVLRRSWTAIPEKSK